MMKVLNLDSPRGEVTITYPEGIVPQCTFNHSLQGYQVTFVKEEVFFLDATAEQWREKVKELETKVSDPKFKIPAIKVLREMFPWLGLRQAKEAVEAMARDYPLPF